MAPLGSLRPTISNLSDTLLALRVLFFLRLRLWLLAADDRRVLVLVHMTRKTADCQRREERRLDPPPVNPSLTFTFTFVRCFPPPSPFNGCFPLFIPHSYPILLALSQQSGSGRPCTLASCIFPTLAIFCFMIDM